MSPRSGRRPQQPRAPSSATSPSTATKTRSSNCLRQRSLPPSRTTTSSSLPAITPVAHPIKGSIERLCKGRAGDETVEDALKAWGGEAAANWLFSIQLWDEDVQTALLTDDDLKKYLPKSKVHQNLVYANSPYIKTDGVDEDDSEMVRADEHRREILASLIANENSGPPTSIYKSAASVGGVEDPITESSPLAAAIPKVDKFGTVKRLVQARMTLLTVKWEDENEKRVLPVKKTELAHLLVTSSTSKTDMTTFATSGVTTMKQEFARSRNYDMRGVELPKLEQVIKSFLGQCLFQTRVTKNLQEKSLEGIVFNVLLPDTVDSLDAKSKIQNETAAEDALDEATEKRTKKNTTFTPVDRITGMETVLKTLTNLLLILAIYGDFDLDATEDTTNWPILARWTKDTQDTITDEDAKEWVAKYGEKVEGIQLAYFIVNSWMGILCKFATFVNDPVQQSKALDDDWTGIKMEWVNKAKKQYKHMMDTLDNVYAGNSEVPDSALWKESADKAEFDKIETLLLKRRLNINNNPARQGHTTNTPLQANTATKTKAGGQVTPGTKSAQKPSSRPKLHNDPANLGTDGMDGYIIGSGPTNWDLPAALNGKRPVPPGETPKFSLCKKFYRKGQKCNYGQSCNRCHKAPKALDQEHLKALWEFMHDNTHNLSWNTELVNVEELRQKYESLSM